MVILFFVALILAWPTAGLSIVVYIVILIAQAILKAKVRMHHVDKIRAEREIASGEKRFPSWMASREKIEEFVYSVENVAEHRGVPKLFSAQIMSNQEVQKNLMHYAGAMEAQGASFTEQQMAVVEKLIEYYKIR